jgi:hypothetical protein
MTYEVILLNADIRDPLDGEMRLALKHEDKTACEIEYRWDGTQFSAIFHGHAPTMPVPAHPTFFIERPIAAIHALKTSQHRFPSDVFVDNRVFISTEPKG